MEETEVKAACAHALRAAFAVLPVIASTDQRKSPFDDVRTRRDEVVIE